MRTFDLGQTVIKQVDESGVVLWTGRPLYFFNIKNFLANVFVINKKIIVLKMK